MSSADFSLGYYKDSLAKALDLGYGFVKTSQALNSQDKKILLRHDVDHDIDLVYRIADLENSLGVCSTFYFRTQAKNYNIFSNKSIEIVNSVIKLGHEIGYHYEFPFEEDKKNLNFFSCNLNLLRSTFLDSDFSVVSPHEPSRSKTKAFLCTDFRKRNNIIFDSYDDILMNNFKYISDSSCRWREGPMHEHIGKHDKLYILTHPIWWFKNSPGECY